jgi:tripartite-type tricarboxylate transporter receptor subunit TctC
VKDSLGTVIIENRPGGGGNIGADARRQGRADGTTIGISAVATLRHQSLALLQDAVRPGEGTSPAITQMAAGAHGLVVNAETAARLNIAHPGRPHRLCQANPGRSNYGSGGNGSAGHLAGEMFKRDAGIFAVHIPYNGGNPAQLALLSGQVDFNFDNSRPPHPTSARASSRRSPSPR